MLLLIKVKLFNKAANEKGEDKPEEEGKPDEEENGNGDEENGNGDEDEMGGSIT
jgi:hypothetical protein